MLIGLAGSNNRKNLEIAQKLDGFQLKSLWQQVKLELIGPMINMYKVNPLTCTESALKEFVPLLDFHYTRRLLEDPQHWVGSLLAYAKYDLNDQRVNTVIWDCDPSVRAWIKSVGGMNFYVACRDSWDGAIFPLHPLPGEFDYPVDASTDELVIASAMFIHEKVREKRNAEEKRAVDGGRAGCPPPEVEAD
jgi:hypothetical protein